MRANIDGTTLALYNSGVYDCHWKLLVANGDDTLINLFGRYKRIELVLPSPDAPIAQLKVDFWRETEGRTSSSLAPLIEGSDWNVLDDTVTYSPLLQLGRKVVLQVAITAVGGTRPIDASSYWYEIFQGAIRNVSWPNWEANIVTINCNDLGGIFQLTKTEDFYLYPSGTNLEDVADDILDNNGFSAFSRAFESSTTLVTTSDYSPGLQKTIWEQLWALALSMGWICYHKYDGHTGPTLTFFPPARTKTVPDMTVTHWWDYESIEIDEEEVRNVGYLQYYDVDGVLQLIGPEEDTASIAQYGGEFNIRRIFWIGLGEDSPIRTSGNATSMLQDALSDVANPDMIASVKTPPLVFAECGTDLYTFPQRGVYFNSNQDLAPFNCRIVVETNKAYSVLGIRGVPSAGINYWGSKTLSAKPIPDHVQNVTINHYIDLSGDPPLVVVEYDPPIVPSKNWYVLLEGRFQNPQSLVWSSWEKYGESETTKAVFRSATVGMIECRPIIIVDGVRADASFLESTSTGGNTSTTLNDTTQNWITNHWAPVDVEIISGTGVGQTRAIASNTATQLVIADDWDTTPDGTSVYKIYKAAPVVQEQITGGIAFGNPVLDEDDGDLYLHPNWLLGYGCKYIDSDTEPTENDVKTSGTIIAQSTMAVGGENIHTFTTDEETRYVGIVYYLDEACTSGASGVTILRYTYHTANNNPRVIWYPYIADDVTKEGVRFLATDDSGQVNFGYAIIDEGDGDPTWPTGYTTSGLTSDPYDESVEITKPAEGGTRKVILFNCVDSDGNLFRPADDPGRIYVDGNARPYGVFNYGTEEDGTPIVIPLALDSDCMSWRFRVKICDVGSEVWDSIAFDDGLAAEFSGNAFVYQDLETFVLSTGECLCVEGQFYRTSATDDTTQSASMASEAMQFVIYRSNDTIIPTIAVRTGQSGTNGTMTLEPYDPQGWGVATAFESYSGQNGTPNADPTLWTDYDPTGVNLSDTVALVEGHNSEIHWAYGFDLNDGNGVQWLVGVKSYDADNIPFVVGFLSPNDDVNEDHLDLSWIGDEDLASIQYLTSSSSMPASVTGGTVVNGRAGRTGLTASLDPGETLYIRVRGYNATGGAAGGGTPSAEDWTAEYTRTKTTSPVVQAIPTQTGTTARVTLVVDQPGNFINGTSFQPVSFAYGVTSPNQDPANWDYFDGAPSYNMYHEETNFITAKHTCGMYWGVRYLVTSGNVWVTGVCWFDLDIQAEIMGISVDFDASNNVDVSVIGDEDCDNIYVNVSVSGTPPADPTSSTKHGTISGNNGVAETSITASMGDQIIVKARGYNSTTPGPVKTAYFKLAATPIVSAEISFNDNGYVIVSATAGSDASNIYINADEDSDPGTPTSSVYDGMISGNAGSWTSTSLQVDIGNEAWVNLRAYDGTVPGPVFGIIKARRGVGSVSKTHYYPIAGILNGGFPVTDGYVYANGTAQEEDWGSVPIPQGVTITNFLARLYRGGASDIAYAYLVEGPYSAVMYVIAEVGGSGTGWTTPSDTANHLVDQATYLRVLFDANTTGDDTRGDYIGITYTTPDVDKTL